MSVDNKKICVIGAFGFDTLPTGGQPVKSRELYNGLRKYTNGVKYVETYEWKKHPHKLLADVIGYAKEGYSFIMLPAHNGVKVFSLLLVYLKRRYGTKIFYDVVGGWLPTLLENNKVLKRMLSKFDGIWVETKSMFNALYGMGFKNVDVVPNFKTINPVDSDKLQTSYSLPLSVCTFSRVTEKKGIIEAIETIASLNRKYNNQIFQLDIYGPIDNGFLDVFNNLLLEHSDFLSYKGIVSSDKSVEVLQNYYALLFPTKFYTEGVPGTIIDAYAAGVPIICSAWKNHKDIVLDGITGWVYEFNNTQMLENFVDKAYTDQFDFIKMKRNALNEFYKYDSKIVMKTIALKIGITD